MGLLDKLVVWSLPVVPKFMVGYFSRNYIAGSTLEKAVAKVKELNTKGIMATMDLLGEEITHKEQATKAADTYITILDALTEQKLDCNVSIKPTHMGLTLDKEFCYNNIKRIVKKAQELNNFVRIDMEDHTTTSDTIEIFLRLKKEFDGHVGTVIQSYLRRTNKDIEQLIGEKANLRLCKGIYVEPRKEAYKDMPIINESYKYNME